MKRLIPLLLIFFFFFTIQNTSASIRNKSSFHGFGAVGALAIPGSFRIGGKSFEVGMLTTGVFGALWNIDLNGSIYSSMGLGLNSGGAGIYGGFGTEFWEYWIIGFRLEAGAFVNYRNDSSGNLLLGINIGF